MLGKWAGKSGVHFLTYFSAQLEFSHTHKLTSKIHSHCVIRSPITKPFLSEFGWWTRLCVGPCRQCCCWCWYWYCSGKHSRSRRPQRKKRKSGTSTTIPGSLLSVFLCLSCCKTRQYPGTDCGSRNGLVNITKQRIPDPPWGWST